MLLYKLAYYDIINLSNQRRQAMAKAQVIISKWIQLDLNEQEAQYLAKVLQNCPFGISPSEEDELEKESRSAIWCELYDCLEIKNAAI